MLRRMSLSKPKVPDNKKIFKKFLEFLESGVWTMPISMFMEQHSILFDREQGDPSIYDRLHKEFGSLVDVLIESYCEDAGIIPRELVDALKNTDKTQKLSYRERVLLEPVVAAQDFNVFVPMMMRKSIEMQLQALHMLTKLSGLLPTSLRLDDEDAEMYRILNEEDESERFILISVLKQSREEWERDKKWREEMEKQFQSTIQASEAEMKYLEEARKIEQHRVEEAMRQNTDYMQSLDFGTGRNAIGTNTEKKKSSSAGTMTENLEKTNSETNTDGYSIADSTFHSLGVYPEDKSIHKEKTVLPKTTITEMAKSSEKKNMANEELIDKDGRAEIAKTNNLHGVNHFQKGGDLQFEQEKPEKSLTPEISQKPKSPEKPEKSMSPSPKPPKSSSPKPSENQDRSKNKSINETRRSSTTKVESTLIGKSEEKFEKSEPRPGSSRPRSVSTKNRGPTKTIDSKGMFGKDGAKEYRGKMPTTMVKPAPGEEESGNEVKIDGKRPISAKRKIPEKKPISVVPAEPRFDYRSLLKDKEGIPEGLLKQRAEYLRQQRDKLLEMKRAEREKQLQTLESNNERPKTAKAARGALQGMKLGGPTNEEVLEARRALASKLKAEVIHGTV